MLGDFFTKPLQEALFVRMQEKVLNLPTCTSIHRSVLEDWKKIWQMTAADQARKFQRIRGPDETLREYDRIWEHKTKHKKWHEKLINDNKKRIEEIIICTNSIFLNLLDYALTLVEY